VGATLITGGGFNLTVDPYRFIAIDLGRPARTENWFQPPVQGSKAQLASFYDTPTQMTIHLKVTGSSVDDLVANLNAVRDEFTQSQVDVTYGGDNWIEYGLGSATNHIVTYASAIDPVDLADVQKLMLATSYPIIPDWSFQVWRDPQFYEDFGTTRVIVG
jgi:hypothetical protein